MREMNWLSRVNLGIVKGEAAIDGEYFERLLVCLREHTFQLVHHLHDADYSV